MLISGTITKVDPPDYRDQYNNHYQTITIQTVAGPVTGRKASKTPYCVNDVNRQVEWECTQQTDKQGGIYNKFTKPQDPRYAQQQGQQGGQQAAQQPKPRDYDAENRGKCRNSLVGAAIQSSQITIRENNRIPDLNYWVEYIMTGKAPLPPAQNQYPDEGSQVPPNSPNPAMGGSDDIPF